MSTDAIPSPIPSKDVVIENPSPGHTGEWTRIAGQPPMPPVVERRFTLDVSSITNLFAAAGNMVGKIGFTRTIVIIGVVSFLLIFVYGVPWALDKIHANNLEIAERHERSVKAVVENSEKQCNRIFEQAEKRDERYERSLEKIGSGMEKQAEQFRRLIDVKFNKRDP